MDKKNADRPKPILIKDDGHVQTFQWPDTGEVFTTTANYAHELPDTPPRDQRLTASFVVENKIPITKQIAVLKGIFPEIGEKSSVELLKEAKESNALKLGVFPAWRAVELVHECEQAGVLVIEEDA